MDPADIGTLESLRTENEILKYELRRSTNMPSNKIGLVLLVSGVLLLVVSFIISSTILVFTGLGLTFWGALFLFARSTKFIGMNILDVTAVASYTTLDRIMHDLNLEGKPTYIPPYPKEAYLPEYLGGLKELVVFIPSKESVTMPPIEEMAKKQFMVKNPKGICITPPGSGLVSLFESELRTDFTKIDKVIFYDNLPAVIVDSLELASDFEIEDEKELVHVKIDNSVYRDLYSKNHNLKSIYSVGSPLTSAVACVLAQITGKLVAISKTEVSPDLKNVEVWYKFIEGETGAASSYNV